MAKVIVQHQVADYDRWLEVFKEHQAIRQSHGATGHSVNRVAGDSNTIVIVNDFATRDGAVAFTKDPSLPAAMAKGGVTGAPQVWIADEADAAAY
jgi:uncharacterized protein (DUF1330 family)